MKEIYAAIITSLIAALVFWVIFDYLPKIVSNNKIKPIIVYDFYCLYQKMLSFISLPFTHQSFPDSSYSGEIISGSVTEDDFRTYLSTKCLSKEYLSIDEMSQLLIPIGEKMKSLTNDVTMIVKRLFIFNNLLTPDQIIMCRQIIDNLNLYSYDSPAFENLGNGMQLKVVNPTVNYMAEMYFTLYSLFLDIQHYLMNSNCKDIAPYYQRNLDSIRVSALYAHHKYGRVAIISKFSKNKSLSKYYFISLFKMNLKKLARRALCQEIRKTSLRLVYMKSSLCDLLQDQKICNILISKRSQDEFDEMVCSINSSVETKSQHEQFARKMRNYYDKKCGYKSL